MDKRLRAHIALQAAYGMEYLHQHYIVHFDLKYGTMPSSYMHAHAGISMC